MDAIDDALRTPSAHRTARQAAIFRIARQTNADAWFGMFTPVVRFRNFSARAKANENGARENAASQKHAPALREFRRRSADTV
jgi:hypothetical protein